MGKKVVAAVLCLVTACAAYGCSFRRDEREEYDPTKRYLYIGNYNGGLGDAWLNALADEYMAEHSDVVIRIENDKDPELKKWIEMYYSLNRENQELMSVLGNYLIEKQNDKKRKE